MAKRKQKNVSRPVKNPLYRIHCLDDHVYIKDMDLRLRLGDLTGVPISAKEIAQSVDLRRALTGEINIDGSENDAEMVKVVLEREFADKLDPSIPNGVDDQGTMISFPEDPFFFDINDPRKEITASEDGSNLIYDLLPIFVAKNCSELRELIKGHKVLDSFDKTGKLIQKDQLIPAAYHGMLVYVEDASEAGIDGYEIVQFIADTEDIVIKNNFAKEGERSRTVRISDRTGKGSFTFSNGFKISGKKEGFSPSISVDLNKVKDLNNAEIVLGAISRRLNGVKFRISGYNLVDFSLAENAEAFVRVNGQLIQGATISSEVVSSADQAGASAKENGLDIIINFPQLALMAKDKVSVSIAEGFAFAYPDEDNDSVADSEEKILCQAVNINMVVSDVVLPNAELTMTPNSGKFNTEYNGDYEIKLSGGDYPLDLSVKEVVCKGLAIVPGSDPLMGAANGMMPASENLKAEFEVLFNETSKSVKLEAEIIGEEIHLPVVKVVCDPAEFAFGGDYVGKYSIEISDNKENLTVKSISVDKGEIDGGLELEGNLSGIKMPDAGDAAVNFIVGFNETPKTVARKVVIKGIDHLNGVITELVADLGEANAEGKYANAIDCVVEAHVELNNCKNIASANVQLDGSDLEVSIENNVVKANLQVGRIYYPVDELSHKLTVIVTFEDGHISAKEMNFTQVSLEAKMMYGYICDVYGDFFGAPSDAMDEVCQALTAEFLLSKVGDEYSDFRAESIGDLPETQYEQDGVFVVAIPTAAAKTVIVRNLLGFDVPMYKQTVMIDGVEFTVLNSASGVQTTLLTIK